MNLTNFKRLLESRRLVLASGSPRRVRLLKEADIHFRQIIPSLDEGGFNHEDPYRLAVLLAEKKAEAVSDLLDKDEIALAGDTIVLLDGRILGKPSSPDEALKMLSKLSGNKHTVCSAVALHESGGETVSGFELTDVNFRSVDALRLKEYVASGEPLDKAGAYGIQGSGGFLVDSIEGNLDNVIGLPMALLDRLAMILMKDRE